MRETYQFVVDRWAFHFVVDDGSIDLRDGWADQPAVTWTTDEETWARLAYGTLTPSDAVDSGALTVQGDARAANRSSRIFSRTRMLSRARGRGPSRSSRATGLEPR